MQAEISEARTSEVDEARLLDSFELLNTRTERLMIAVLPSTSMGASVCSASPKTLLLPFSSHVDLGPQACLSATLEQL